MSMKYVRALRLRNAVLAQIKMEKACEEAGVDITDEDFGKPRNRAEKRAKVNTLPRSFRTSVHGKGQWRRKVVTENGLERP